MLKIREKLLLSFFTLSLLTFLVSMIFYNQLRFLIQPLSPQSIPRSVDLLGDTIEKSNLIFKLLYQQLLVNNYFENYLFTQQLALLQAYYAGDAELIKVIQEVKNVDPKFPKDLEGLLRLNENERVRLLQFSKTRNVSLINELNPNSQYSILKNKLNNIINDYYRQSEHPSSEAAIVSVKLSVKDANTKLENSLNSTLIIFLDALVVSIVLTIISSRSISQPINLLKEDIERADIEKLNISIDPSLLRLEGEIGDLARAFDQLLYRLRATTVLRDELLTEVKHRKKIEKELRHVAANLRESNYALDQFAYIASHDLRAPLRAIENLADWIQEDSYEQLSEKSRNHFDLLKQRVQRLDKLISGILEYSRAGIVSKEQESVDIKEVLDEMIDDLSPPKNINMIIDTILPTINCNRTAITQVFLNLLSNAIKYMNKPQGVINVGYKLVPRYYQFYVADNGLGIDPQYQDKIFDIFQTVPSRDSIDSTGIGLAIVKRIVEKHGGRVWLTSEINQGATFYFTWPQF